MSHAWLPALISLLAGIGEVSAATPWPHPSKISTGQHILSLREAFSFQVTNPVGAHKHLHSTAARYTDAIRNANGIGCNITTSVSMGDCSVTVLDESVALAQGVDESYQLDISAAGHCKITAPTVWGAFHAMESVSQLADENCTITNAPISITDAPRFEFRGLMIDSARHYLPVPFIEHILDAMQTNKLNVLHWHIVDSQSFPYVSAQFPGLSRKGAYSQRATYSPDELRGLVDYAESRGVRIMPEFDMPGHGDWEQGEPKIMVTDGPCKNTMNPTVDETYTFLSKFLEEVTTVFPDNFLFLGGDEVNGDCWSGSPTVKKWMDAHNMNASALGRHFWQQVTARVLPKLNRTLGVWEDDQPQPHPDDLPPGSFGNIWQAQKTIKSAVGRKFNSVLSGPWYLDQQKPGGCSQYSLEGMWQCFYDVEPLKGLTAAESKYVWGGQGCQWSEGINVHNFDARTWTNLAAVGERLWSPRADSHPVIAASAATRLVDHICRMNARGIDANPIQPSYCPQADFMSMKHQC